MYVIQTPRGLVSGYSFEHQCVQVAGLPEYVKRFATEQEAKLWLCKYADRGYGLETGTATVRRED